MLVESFKKNNTLILIFILLAVIIASYLAINILDKNNSASNTSDYKSSYFELQKDLAQIGERNNLSQKGAYQRILTTLDELTNEKLSQTEQYDKLQLAFQYYYATYQETNLHDLYTNGKIFDDFAKKNFKELYKSKDFVIKCQDPECATTTQPAEIETILEEIQQSDFPDPVKETVLNDIKNDGYFQSADDRARNYILSINIIRGYDPYSTSGANEKIANDIEEFVKNKYPDEYLKYKGFLQVDNTLNE